MARGSVEHPVVLHTEASLGFGGQEIRILAESRWLAAHGRRALVAAQPGARLLAEAERASVPALAVRMRGAWDLAAVAALRRLIRAHDVGLVHTHSSVDAWVAGLAARSLAIPVVRSRHVTIPIPRRRALVYRLADRVITSGEAVAAIVRGAGVPADRVVAVGTPVVGTTVGGTPELVRDGETGRLVPPADAAALAGAILDFLRDPERARALARRGQALVLTQHSMDAAMARTLAVYDAVGAPAKVH